MSTLTKAGIVEGVCEGTVFSKNQGLDIVEMS
jgi:hypothetical protein